MGEEKYTKLHFLILTALYKDGCTSKFKSYTKKQILKTINEKQEKMKLPTVIKALNIFLELGFVKKGMNDKQSNTFYITEKGIDEIKKYANDEEMFKK